MVNRVGVRLYLDGKLFLEELANRRTRTITKEIDLEAGHAVDLRLEYFENANQYAAAKLVWSPPSAAQTLR